MAACVLHHESTQGLVLPTRPAPTLSAEISQYLDRGFHTFLRSALKNLPRTLSAEAVLALSENSRDWWREHTIKGHQQDYSACLKRELSNHAEHFKNLDRHGILLLGGTGSRLETYTSFVNKHLLPVYDQPLYSYSLAALMMTGARSISVVTTPHDATLYRELLGDGSRYGIELRYVIQSEPKGIAHAIAQVRPHIATDGVSVALGDNVLYGPGLAHLFTRFLGMPRGAQAFTCTVEDPFHFDVVDFNAHGDVLNISLKPEIPSSPQVLTGVLIYDSRINDRSVAISKGYKGEYQLHDVHRMYLQEGAFYACPLPPTIRWFDAGRQESLFKSSLQLALDANGGDAPLSPHIVAESLGWISEGATSL